MKQTTGPAREQPTLSRLLAYVADLELEIDRLRRHAHLIRQEVKAALQTATQLAGAPAGGAAAAEGQVGDIARQLAGVLRDLQELPGSHPAHDQVVDIAVRPLAEQVFRWQQRLQGAPAAALELELECESMAWFPARLRHVLDNLVSNALRYRDPDKPEARVRLGVRATPDWYEVRVSDNGVGLGQADRDRAFDLFYRAAPARAAGLGVGLAVVKMLVEQSGGALKVESEEGSGTAITALLPRYELDDFLI
jgi:signal transduction histidine kinase